MDYRINEKYNISELDNINKWWQTNRQYDINEYREPREYITKKITETDTEMGKECVIKEEQVLVEREYNDYIEIVKRPDNIVLDMLRASREPLLIAFDKWEKAVIRGRELDDEEIMAWYQDLLDLKDSAFKEVPDRVKYYL